MKCHFIPVARMYRQGAARIRAADVPIAGQDPILGTRLAVEAYPALVAQALGGTRSYKTDTPRQKTPEQLSVHREARARIVAALETDNAYGFRVSVPDKEFLIEESGADRLDAVLAALQTAWASGQQFLGAPIGFDRFEGWICDPSLLSAKPPALTADLG